MELAAAGDGLRRGTWTEEEDRLLRRCIRIYGEGRWHLVPARAGLNRCRKSCRLRWLNYLKPNIKRGEFEGAEVDLLIKMHKLLGNRWSLIAGRLPGRTANDVKNYWNTHHKEKEKKLTTTTSVPALSHPSKRRRQQQHWTTNNTTEVAVVPNYPNEPKITKTNIIRPRPSALSKGFRWAHKAQSPLVVAAAEDMNGGGSGFWVQELKRFLEDDGIDFPATFGQLSSTEVNVNERNYNSSCSNSSKSLMMFDHCWGDANIWDHLDS